MQMRQGWILAAVMLCAAPAVATAQNGWVTILDASSFQDWKVAPERAGTRVEETATAKRIVAGDPKRDGAWTFEDRCLWTYCLVDELWARIAPRCRRPGPAPVCSDAEPYRGTG